MQTWQLYSQTYPNDDIPTSNLSVLYARLGDYESALKFSLKGIQLAPDSNYGYLKAACAYDGLGRFEEAKAIADESIKKWAIRPFAHTMLLNTAIAEGDTAAEEKQMALAAEDTSDMIRFVWPAQAGRGQLQKVRSSCENGKKPRVAKAPRNSLPPPFATKRGWKYCLPERVSRSSIHHRFSLFPIRPT